MTDFAAVHERVAERKGEKRTSGWRRMYRVSTLSPGYMMDMLIVQKAAEEARERQQNAAERVAERYREMDKERAEKKIVVLNQVIQPKAAKRIVGGVFGQQRQPSGMY